MRTVTKKELIERVSDKTGGTTKGEVHYIIQMFLDEMVNSIVDGNRIEMRDFGVFTPKDREPRQARNPKTGETVNVPRSKSVAFRVGKEFKSRLSRSVAAKPPAPPPVNA